MPSREILRRKPKPKDARETPVRPKDYARKTPVQSIRDLGDVNRTMRVMAMHWYLSDMEIENLLRELVEGNAIKGTIMDRTNEHPYSLPPNELTKRRFDYILRDSVTERVLLDFMQEREKRGKLIIIGNGGSAGCGLLLKVANMASMMDYTIVWHGGDSDENFEHSYAMHAGITYEPHRELQFLELNKDTTDIKTEATMATVFVNQLSLVYPKTINFEEYYKSLCTDVTAWKTWNTHERYGYALVRWVLSDGKRLSHGKFGYISRYNHSAIGEHDRIMWTLGCARFIETHNDIKTDVATMLSEIVRKYIVRDQTLYPSTMKDTAERMEAPFYLNDLGFIDISSENHLGMLKGETIDNPAQLWFTPMYDGYGIDMKMCLKKALRSDDVASYMRGVVQTTAGDCKYIQDYLKHVNEVYNICPESYVQDWSVMQPRAASIAHVQCGEDKCFVSDLTVDDLIRETALHKISKLNTNDVSVSHSHTATSVKTGLPAKGQPDASHARVPAKGRPRASHARVPAWDARGLVHPTRACQLKAGLVHPTRGCRPKLSECCLLD